MIPKPIPWNKVACTAGPPPPIYIYPCTAGAPPPVSVCLRGRPGGKFVQLINTSTVKLISTSICMGASPGSRAKMRYKISQNPRRHGLLAAAALLLLSRGTPGGAPATRLALLRRAESPPPGSRSSPPPPRPAAADEDQLGLLDERLDREMAHWVPADARELARAPSRRAGGGLSRCS